MREIIFDTETTGLDRLDDRVIEIGGVELINRFPTGRTFHVYINPEGKTVHPDALAVHGISNEQLADKSLFAGVLHDFLDFIDGAKLIAHNAMFDMGFINAELNRLGHPPIHNDRVVDTLALARRKHPMGPNSLDALCRRYGIDNSHRTMHGALLELAASRGGLYRADRRQAGGSGPDDRRTIGKPANLRHGGADRDFAAADATSATLDRSGETRSRQAGGQDWRESPLARTHPAAIKNPGSPRVSHHFQSGTQLS